MTDPSAAKPSVKEPAAILSAVTAPAANLFEVIEPFGTSPAIIAYPTDAMR